MIGAIIGGTMAAINMVGSYYTAKQEEERRKRDLELQKKAALMRAAGIEDSTVIMKGMNIEATTNATRELFRASAANIREDRLKIKKVESSLVAKTEGLTSGVSAGRQLLASRVAANKVILKDKSKESGMLVQLLDNKNKVENQLNQKMIDTNFQLQSVLSQKFQGTSEFTKLFGAIGAGVQGFQSGYALGGAVGKQFNFGNQAALGQ